MIAAPKPLASERKQANHERKVELQSFRHIVRAIIYRRSKGICEICGKLVVNDIHHVYGRGRDKSDWREKPSSMLAVCRKCHPQPIKHKPAGPKLAWVEEILEKINEREPIQPKVYGELSVPFSKVLEKINGGATQTIEAATAAADGSEIE